MYSAVEMQPGNPKHCTAPGLGVFRSKANSPSGPMFMMPLATPRDLTGFNPEVDAGKDFQLSGDFRIKGWAEKDFQGCRNPTLTTKEELEQERTRLAGYPVYPHPHTESQSAQNQDGVKDSVNDTIPESANQSPLEPTSEQRYSSPLKDSGGLPFIRDPYHEKTPAEVTKLQQQFLEADREILRYKQERLERLKQENEAKRRDLEQLQKYDPFGRPGGGAPSNGARKQKFLEEDLTPREQPQYRKPVEMANSQDFFSATFGRPGGGAPLKSETGALQTTIRADPSIRFQEKENLRQSIENHIRYHKPQNETQQYNIELDQQIKENKMKQQTQRLEDLKKEIEMMKHDPFGRPGAGAPNKTNSGNQKLGLRNVPLDGNIDADNLPNSQTESDSYHPWGKGNVQPLRHHDGSVVRHRNPLSNKYTPQLRDEQTGLTQGTTLQTRGIGGGGAPHIGEDGQLITRLPATMNTNDFGETVIKEEVAAAGQQRPNTWSNQSQAYFPFGRPGAGAPRRDEQGRILTTVKGKLEREVSSANDLRKAKAAQAYHNELARGVEEQQRNKKDLENYMKAPVGELAAVLRGGQVGKPKRDPATGMLLPQHRGTSDVTQLKIHDINYRAATDSRHYHEDLTKAAEERYRSRELEKLKEKQEAKNHEKVFSDFWGRPGAGAPTGNYRKLNLEDKLFANKQLTHGGDWDYVKNPNVETTRSTGDLDNAEFERYMSTHGPLSERNPDQKYVRNTVQSTHVNQYDFDYNRRRGERVHYKVDAPWANAI